MLFSVTGFLMLTYRESSCPISAPAPFKAQGLQSAVDLKSTLYNGIFKSKIIYIYIYTFIKFKRKMPLRR